MVPDSKLMGSRAIGGVLGVKEAPLTCSQACSAHLWAHLKPALLISILISWKEMISLTICEVGLFCGKVSADLGYQ